MYIENQSTTQLLKIKVAYSDLNVLVSRIIFKNNLFKECAFLVLQ